MPEKGMGPILKMTRRRRRGERDMKKDYDAKEHIFDALSAMMQEKKLEKIRVSEVISRAHVSRSTFYYHFSNLEDVLQQMMAIFYDILRETVAIDQGFVLSRTREGYIQDRSHALLVDFIEKKEWLTAILHSPRKWEFCEEMTTIYRDSYAMISGFLCIYQVKIT